MTPDSKWTLVILGAALLFAFAAHVLGRRAHVPRVTLLMLLGVALGPSGFDLIPFDLSQWFPLATQAALSMVGFLLGQHFRLSQLRRVGHTVLFVSVGESLLAGLVVLIAVWASGFGLLLAILFAALAPSTAPAATLDVTRETHSRGPVTETLLGVVAIDDAWALILLSLALAAATGLVDGAWSVAFLGSGVYEIAGAIVLGLVLGFPMAWLSGRLVPGELTLLEALGFVLLAGGLAQLIGVSYLLTCMTVGTVVANTATHHERVFHAVEGVSDPFLAIFFLLAGFEFQLSQLLALPVLGAVYIVGRAGGKLLGARLGASLAGAPQSVRRHLGWCLLPQAGVALGAGLIVAERFPEVGATLLSTVVATTIVFELLGPVVTRRALERAGEAGATR